MRIGTAGIVVALAACVTPRAADQPPWWTRATWLACPPDAALGVTADWVCAVGVQENVSNPRLSQASAESTARAHLLDGMKRMRRTVVDAAVTLLHNRSVSNVVQSHEGGDFVGVADARRHAPHAVLIAHWRSAAGVTYALAGVSPNDLAQDLLACGKLNEECAAAAARLEPAVAGARPIE